MFQDFFGSFACSFGITQVGGGYYAPDLSTGAISSEDQGEGGLLVYAGVLGAVGLIDLGVFISDSLNPSKPGRVPPPPGSDGGGNGLDGGTSPWTTVTTGFTGPIITSPGLGPFTSSPSWTAYYLGAYGRPMITPGTIFKHTTVARICVGLASLAFIGVSVLVSQPGAARENEGGEAGKALLGGAASAGSFFAVCYGVGSFIARMPH